MVITINLISRDKIEGNIKSSLETVKQKSEFKRIKISKNIRIYMYMQMKYY